MKLENKRSLPINFYDCPGINADEDERMNLQVLEAVIKGHVRGNVQVVIVQHFSCLTLNSYNHENVFFHRD